MPIGGLYQVTTAGSLTRMAGDLMSPTGFAIGPDGTAYVSMLFASTVLAIPYGGAPETFAEIPFPGDVDYANGSVFVTESGLTDEPGAPPSGKVWEFPLDMG